MAKFKGLKKGHFSGSFSDFGFIPVNIALKISHLLRVKNLLNLALLIHTQHKEKWKQKIKN